MNIESLAQLMILFVMLIVNTMYPIFYSERPINIGMNGSFTKCFIKPRHQMIILAETKKLLCKMYSLKYHFLLLNTKCIGRFDLSGSGLIYLVVYSNIKYKYNCKENK